MDKETWCENNRCGVFFTGASSDWNGLFVVFKHLDVWNGQWDGWKKTEVLKYTRFCVFVPWHGVKIRWSSLITRLVLKKQHVFPNRIGCAILKLFLLLDDMHIYIFYMYIYISIAGLLQALWILLDWNTTKWDESPRSASQDASEAWETFFLVPVFHPAFGARWYIYIYVSYVYTSSTKVV